MIPSPSNYIDLMLGLFASARADMALRPDEYIFGGQILGGHYSEVYCSDISMIPLADRTRSFSDTVRLSVMVHDLVTDGFRLYDELKHPKSDGLVVNKTRVRSLVVGFCLAADRRAHEYVTPEISPFGPIVWDGGVEWIFWDAPYAYPSKGICVCPPPVVTDLIGICLDLSMTKDLAELKIQPPLHWGGWSGTPGAP